MATNAEPQRVFADDVLALAHRFGVITVELAFRLGWYRTRPEVMLALRQVADSGQLRTRTATVSSQGHVLTYFAPSDERYGNSELCKRLSVAAFALETQREFSGLLRKDQIASLEPLRRIGGLDRVSRMACVVEKASTMCPARLWVVVFRPGRELQPVRSSVDRWASLPAFAAWKVLVQAGQAGVLVFLTEAPAGAPAELSRWYRRAPLLVQLGGQPLEVPVDVARADPLRGGLPKKTKDP